MAASQTLVSIVVLTKNRAKSLERTLDSLQKQDYSHYEVIVVNNGSTDNTEDITNNFPVQYILCSEPSISFCRQRGIEAAQGEIIAMCDDDCVPTANWVSSLIQPLEQNKQIALVAGEVVNIGFPIHQQYKGRGKIGKNGVLKPAINPLEADYFGSANMAFRKSYFLDIGGYDLFFTSAYEEVDLIARFKKAGLSTQYNPNASVEHHFTDGTSRLRVVYSGKLFRIYYYLKHNYPDTFNQWITFIAYENWLFAKDIGWGLKNLFNVANKKWSFSKSAILLLNSFIARIAIPWIIWRSRLSATSDT